MGSLHFHAIGFFAPRLLPLMQVIVYQIFLDCFFSQVVADIDGDGTLEIIVAASYFFDREYYDNPEHKAELPEGVDIGKYIAGAIVVFDSLSHQVSLLYAAGTMLVSVSPL